MSDTQVCCICKQEMRDDTPFMSDLLGSGHALCIATWSESTAANARRNAHDEKSARSRHNWIKNQLKSGIAEFACRQHFLAIDYDVESIGIEHVAPRLVGLKHAASRVLPEFAQSELRALPDFLVSRRSPYIQESADAAHGAVQMMLVEAKYRSKIDLLKLEAELYRDRRYNKLLERGAHIVFYVVVREPLQDGRRVDDHVFINRSWAPQWLAPGETHAEPLLHPLRSDESFAQIYEYAILPALNDIWRAATVEDAPDEA